MLRAVAPRPWAIAIQTAASAVTQRAEGAEHRSGAVADGARSRPPAAGGCRAALGALAGTPGSGARAASSGRLGPAGTGPAAAGRGRALAPRPRRGRRTGRHGDESRPKSHQSHAPQGACRRQAWSHALRTEAFVSSGTSSEEFRHTSGPGADHYLGCTRPVAHLTPAALTSSDRSNSREISQAGSLPGTAGGGPRRRPGTAGRRRPAHRRRRRAGSLVQQMRRRSRRLGPLSAERATGKVGFVRAGGKAT